MEDVNFGLYGVAMVFSAGLGSVMSPCVLPVLPIVVTGSTQDDKLRPLLIVTGLALAFVTMGVITSIFGAFIGPWMQSIEKFVAAAIIAFGLLILFNINLFKHLSFMSSFMSSSQGTLGGFLLGAVLGVVWIPCVGPLLSGVLAMVATEGKILTGIVLLLIYSAGFSIPILLAGYFSFFFRTKTGFLKRNPMVFNVISGVILIGFGILILRNGMMGF